MHTDAAVVEAWSIHGLLVVADGMGGAAGGELASSIAVDALEAAFRPDAVDPRSDVVAAIRGAVVSAHEAIRETVRNRPELRGMGTTIIAAALSPEGAVVAHVGDSPGYIMRDGEVTRLTMDHTAVAEGIERGMLTPEEAKTSPLRGQLTRAVGATSNAEADVGVLRFLPGDVLVLCSDGVSEVLSEADFERVLARSRDAASAAEALVALAEVEGGSDNATVAVAFIGPRKPVGAGASVRRLHLPSPPPRPAAWRIPPSRERTLLLIALAASALLLFLMLGVLVGRHPEGWRDVGQPIPAPMHSAATGSADKEAAPAKDVVAEYRLTLNPHEEPGYVSLVAKPTGDYEAAREKVQAPKVLLSATEGGHEESLRSEHTDDLHAFEGIQWRITKADGKYALQLLHEQDQLLVGPAWKCTVHEEEKQLAPNPGVAITYGLEHDDRYKIEMRRSNSVTVVIKGAGLG
jgi:protein phosphatase